MKDSFCPARLYGVGYSFDLLAIDCGGQITMCDCIPFQGNASQRAS